MAWVMGLSGGAARAESQDIFAKWLSGADGFAQAAQKHEAAEVPVLVYIYTDWCPYCRRFNKEIVASEAMDDYLDDIVAVRLNPERGAREQAISNQFGVHGYPALYVLPAKSNQPRKIYPYRKEGDGWVLMSPSEFVEACQQVSALPKETPSAHTTRTPRLRRPRSPLPESAAPTPPSASSFSPRHPVTLYLTNSERLTGELVSETPQELTLRLEYGEVVFERSEIQRLEREPAEPTSATPDGQTRQAP